ncbi:MAG TPA: N-acetylmuramoyl-L-alanine amidase, partial [Clostridia bacterium]|nr:N-acetylmuramoyl-L-alanine amidase [Clostridia bacterium]
QVETRNGGQGWIANWLVVLRTVQNQASRSAEPGDRPRPALPLYTGSNKLLDIETKPLPDGLLVSIAGEYPLNYSHFSLTNPRRLVIDFFNTTLELGWEGDFLPVNNELVSLVRVGQFTEDQARVVIDFNDLFSAGFSMSEDGKRLVVKLQPPTIKGKTIVIDPGHGSLQPGGWSDPGAVGPNGVYEKDIVLDIGLKVAELLTQEGAAVVLTRTGNTVLSLGERAQVANEINADLFVSIHANASTSPSLTGTATYYYAPWSTQLGTQRAAREKLARYVQQELVQELQRRDIGTLEENFSVLRNTSMPSILVETAFISNLEEERLLSQEAFRQKAAQAVVRGIIRFFAEP